MVKLYTLFRSWWNTSMRGQMAPPPYSPLICQRSGQRARRWMPIVLTAVGLVSSAAVQAGYEPVVVSGYNADVVANGVGAATSSVTANADGGSPGYALVAADFQATSSSALPTYFLPANRTINSAATSGVVFQLEDYSVPNALRLTGTNAGLLSFATPKYASEVYVLALSGTGASTATFTLNFADGSTQTFTNVSIADWYNGTPIARQGIGRVALSDNGQDGSATNPRLYEIKLTLNAANYSKQITSVNVAKTNTTLGVTVVVMGISVNELPACVAPVAQASALSLTPTLYNITGSFSAAAPTADKYLVLRTNGTAAPTVLPANGTTYTVGSMLGNATVISAGAATTFDDVTVSGNTTYTYTVYAYNDVSCYNVAYNTASPISESASTPACAPIAGGTYSVGPSGNYTSITSALQAIYLAGGATGNVTLELQPTYSSSGETFPITIPNLSTGPCATGAPVIKLVPAAGAFGLVISSNATPATIDFNGSRNFVLDGRPGGVGNAPGLRIENTAAAGVAVRFVNEASYNTLTYCDIAGQNTSTTSTSPTGVVYLGGTTGANGNDHNHISYNHIHATAGGFPAMGISAYGNTSNIVANNDSNMIVGNDVYDFFHASASSTGIKVDQGNTAWTINGNHLYQTANRTYTTGATHRGLWITPNVGSLATSANNFNIANNFIGGTEPNAGGTPYTMTASNATLFWGMDLSLGAGTASSVAGNVIRNITLTSTSTSTSGVFIGINTANGIIDIGSAKGNTIGASTGTGSITVTNGSGGTSFGIRVGGGNNITVAKDTVGAITINGSSATVATNFIGIGSGITNGGANLVTITGNVVGSLTTPNSIQMASGYTGTLSNSFTGINITSGVTTSSISNNIVSNIHNTHTGGGTSSFTRGIAVTTSASSITGNTVRNLSTNSLATGGGLSSAVSGIIMSNSNAAGCTVSGNTIHSLSLSNATSTAASNMTGIFYSGTSSVVNDISRNYVHSFDLVSANTNVVMTALDHAVSTSNIVNNIFRLGIKPDGTPLSNAVVVRGISSNSSSSTNNIWFNTIYIGGTGVGPTVKSSFAFTRTSTSGTYDIRNNIFANVRSNAGSGGKHYGLHFTTSAAGASINYNLYQAGGTDGFIGYTGTADVASYTAGWIAGDDNSLTGDPKFINATGSADMANLHIQSGVSSPVEGAGVAIPSVTIDFDGEDRTQLTPTDIGADAGDFGNTLPVVLLHFKGERTVQGNKLSWSTASEINNKGFYLERSADGRSFSPIVFVESKTIGGNSTFGNTYSFIDNKTKLSSSYYRLRQVDQDARETVSNVVLLKGEKTNVMIVGTVYPNPTAGDVKVVVEAPGTLRTTLVITDLAGKVVYNQQQQVEQGSNNIVVPVSSLAAGQYFIRLVHENGSTGSVKFIKL